MKSYRQSIEAGGESVFSGDYSPDKLYNPKWSAPYTYTQNIHIYTGVTLNGLMDSVHYIYAEVCL